MGKHTNDNLSDMPTNIGGDSVFNSSFDSSNNIF